MRSKISLLLIVSLLCLMFTGCDALDKVESGLNTASETVEQLERIEEKATDLFGE